MNAQPPKQPVDVAGRENMPTQPVEYTVPDALKPLVGGKDRVSEAEFSQLMSSVDKNMAELPSMVNTLVEVGKDQQGGAIYETMGSAAYAVYAARRSKLPAEEKAKLVAATEATLDQVTQLAVANMQERVKAQDPAIMAELAGLQQTMPGFPKDYNPAELRPDVVAAFVKGGIQTQADIDNGLEAQYEQQQMAARANQKQAPMAAATVASNAPPVGTPSVPRGPAAPQIRT